MLVEYNELPLSSKTKLCFLSQSTCDRLHFSTNYCQNAFNYMIPEEE